MKKQVFLKRAVLMLFVVIISYQNASAQIPILEIIKAGVKKVIMAVDLQVQRMQNKTIWLQNAQKEMENILSETKLDEISDWVQQQKDLYKVLHCLYVLHYKTILAFLFPHKKNNSSLLLET